MYKRQVRNVFEWNAVDADWDQITSLMDNEFISDIAISSDGNRIAWSNKTFGDVYIGNITPGSITGVEQVGTAIPLENGLVSAALISLLMEIEFSSLNIVPIN